MVNNNSKYLCPVHGIVDSTVNILVIGSKEEVKYCQTCYSQEEARLRSIGSLGYTNIVIILSNCEKITEIK